MIAYYPMPKFPPISISPCKLMCKHCMGKYLKGMRKIYDANKLLSLKNENLNGVLISGGFNKKGELENLEKMIPAMKILRRKFCVALHPGFLNKKIFEELKESIDISFVDLPSNNGIKNVYGLQATTDDYFQNMENFIDAGIMVSPHITVGLNYGKIEEWEILDRVKEYKVVKVVIDVIIPTKGTPFEKVIINMEELKEFLIESRKKLKRVAIGCMRPRGMGIEEMAYEVGINEMAAPPLKLIKKVDSIKRKEMCCGCP